ncbi:MAG: hypothetical protein BVN34_08595 [Proteobacteria bacterium ST_bin12]|nr:MAG: hypothetical protein BVN34_08595 [Proteobacteria bacterium ST_bin12]
MYIYFDTEFTTLIARIQNIKLISAGFVAEDGQEFYFELPNNYRKTDCSYFVSENVTPHLDGGEKVAFSSFDAVIKLKDWVESFEVPVTFLTDAPSYDWILINELFYRHGDYFPKNLSHYPMNVASLRLETGIGLYFDKNEDEVRHHALCDARALAYACKY